MSAAEPGAAPPTGLPPTGRVRRGGALLSAVVLVVVLAVGGWYVWTRREEVGAALGEIGVAAALGCLALTLLGVLATGECWRVWLASVADAPPVRTSHQVFYLTQSGKYLPGSLWPFLAQALVARRFGVPRSAMLSASTLFLVTHLVTGAAVGLVAVGPVMASGRSWLLWTAAGLGLLVLCPPVLARLLGLVDRVRRRRGRPVPAPSWLTVGRTVGLMLLAWAAYGTSTWLLVRELTPVGDTWAPSVGAYAVAWVVGFVAVAAPAGIGAREAVLVLALAPLVGAPSAVSVALVSRAALTVTDLGLAAASSGVLRSSPRGPGDGHSGVPSAGPGR